MYCNSVFEIEWLHNFLYHVVSLADWPIEQISLYNQKVAWVLVSPSSYSIHGHMFDATDVM